MVSEHKHLDIMKNLTLYSLVVGISFFVSCGDSEEEMMDCSTSSLEISLVGTTDAECAIDGSLEVSVSGGMGSVEFDLDGAAEQSSGEFSVSAGTYTVTATDEIGCTSSIDVTVSGVESSVVISNVNSANSDCSSGTGTIEILASGGTGALQYQLNDGNFQLSNSFTNVSAGDYVVTVKDEESCSTTRNKQVLTDVSLLGDIMPLLALKCTFSGCHNGDNGTDRNWTVKSNVLSKAAGIKTRTQNGSMPATGSLTQGELDLIACWVDDGGLDN